MNDKTKEIIEKYKNVTPVPIVKIASELGLEIYETNDFESTQSGSIKKNDNGSFTIYVNANHPTTRKRFTIAHEIAHFLEHQNMFTQENSEHISFSKQPVNVLNRNETNISDYIEKEANEIAAELLMPKEKFIEVWEKANKISDVSDVFCVSQSAAAIRGAKICHSMIT